MSPIDTSEPLPFSPSEPLPSGVFAVEASAGTGKTYTLAGLATRYLAEGTITASELLMVTFTRAATGELRSRVRERVSEAAEHLGQVLAARGVDTSDPFLAWIASPEAPGGTLQQRLKRLEVALSEFDSATITTIHGFAAQVLGALGVSSGSSLELRFAEDGDELLLEACSDVLVAAAADPAVTADLPTWLTFTKKVRAVLGSPDVVVTPAAGDTDAPGKAVLLAQLVRDTLALIRDRRRRRGTQSFDDLLVRLRDALADPVRGQVAASMLRSRFGVALIDEFQDTDPVQWEIFHTLFAPSATVGGSAGDDAEVAALVLVGDPKQAIYSFRGADVTTYVAAVNHTDGIDKRTLETNWRSDGPVLDATATLFDGITFGDGIHFGPVGVAAGNELQQLRRSDVGDEPMTAVEVRCLTSPSVRTSKGAISSPVAKDAINADLVAHTIGMLDRCVLPDDRPGASRGATRPLRPKDIAVLVRSNDSAQAVQSALLAAGVPAVLARGASVVQSPAAEQLTWLLEALVRPSDQRRARTFAVSWFGGRSPEWVAGATEGDIGQLQDRLVGWSALLATRGVVEFMRTVWAESGVVECVLAMPDGDRSATDLEHLGELLRTAVGDAPMSPAGLLAALAGLQEGVKTQADTDRDTDVTSRRVESDAEAVQIMTVWVSKGLEFPVVLCPNLWSAPNPDLDYHDPATGLRTVDVEAPGAAEKRLAAEVAIARREHADEAMRLLYVALTRARHHTSIWWVNSASADKSALAKVLFARESGGALSADLLAEHSIKEHLPAHEDTVGRLAPLAALSDGAIAVRDIGDPTALADVRWTDPTAGVEQPALDVAVFGRRGATALQRSRSRWSFTGIVSRDITHGDPWDLTIDDEGADDEQRPPDVGLGDDAAAGDAADPLAAQPGGAQDDAPADGGPAVSPLAWLPAGAAFGTLAHDVLEIVDFTAGDLSSEVRAAVVAQQQWRSLSLRPVGDQRAFGDPAAEQAGTALLVDGLEAVIETPLGPLFDTGTGSPLRMRDIAPGDRLDEMAFELNLAGFHGHDRVRVAPTDAAIGRLLLDHLAAGDPFRPWAAHLADGVFRVNLEGHLTGSIDAVIRLAGAGDQPDRFVVVDYKTNRLHDHGAEPVAGDYGAASMQRSMMEHHYPLQALLYSVALHRYLRWRLPDYDPAANLGGTAYFFLRGMAGAGVTTDGAAPEGVCSWNPPESLVPELSDLLDSRHPILDAGVGR